MLEQLGCGRMKEFDDGQRQQMKPTWWGLLREEIFGGEGLFSVFYWLAAVKVQVENKRSLRPGTFSYSANTV